LNNRFLLASPKGKPQFAQIKGQIFDDPNKIIKEIETIEAIKNIQPQKIVEKTEKKESENKMDEALDIMQKYTNYFVIFDLIKLNFSILYADLLTSSKTKKYDGLFHLDGSSQLELWMEDDSLKERMFMALIKIDAANGNGQTIQINDNEQQKEVEFMSEYFKTKYRGTNDEKDIFLISHEKAFKDLQSEFPEVLLN